MPTRLAQWNAATLYDPELCSFSRSGGREKTWKNAGCHAFVGSANLGVVPTPPRKHACRHLLNTRWRAEYSGPEVRSKLAAPTPAGPQRLRRLLRLQSSCPQRKPDYPNGPGIG